jgi:murein DD-endopeptidase MepM/ murein hydrolase activator NlpD
MKNLKQVFPVRAGSPILRFGLGRRRHFLSVSLRTLRTSRGSGSIRANLAKFASPVTSCPSLLVGPYSDSGGKNLTMRLNSFSLVCCVLLQSFAGGLFAAENSRQLFRVVDLNRGEARQVRLADGKTASVKLLEVQETRDPLRSAIRDARVTVVINERRITLHSGNYYLPIKIAGVQIDCPVTKGYYIHCDPFEDSWGLDKDVRLRLWPARSTWFEPGKFVYPARQRWFATQNQMGNEPSYVDGGDCPPRPIYYHSGNDIGGCEGMVDVISACDGVVVSAGGKALEGYANAPFYKPHGDYDYVYVVDDRGWYYRYAHLQSIDPSIKPGKAVNAGDKLGVLGKEGSSGGWSHLHFDIKAPQPSGKWGIQDAYAFLWEAYRREQRPEIIAVARPHHLAQIGDPVLLDGSKSLECGQQNRRLRMELHGRIIDQGRSHRTVLRQTRRL